MAETGSTSNVIAGIASFFIPGLGQLVQGRILGAGFMFVLALLVHVVTFGLLGWVVHVGAALEAAVYRPKNYLPQFNDSSRHSTRL